MPRTQVVFYREEDGTVPLVVWLDTLPTKAQDKCRVRIERLKEMAHELRRPEADYLRDGSELRTKHASVNYRMLYFFHRNVAAVLSHGLAKERAVPPVEIDRAIERKRRFEGNPNRHTYREESHAD